MKTYITAKEAAEAWGVSRRYVNLCISENRIPGICRMGNMWLIPADTQKPAGKRRPQSPLPAELAHILETSIGPLPLHGMEDERLHFAGELAYLRGDFERVADCFRQTAGDEAARLRAASVAIAAAISTGDYPFYLEIETFLKDTIQKTNDESVVAFAELCLATAYVSALAPNMVPAWLQNGDYARLHPKAIPDAVYKRAKYFQCLGKFESMLAVSEIALAFCATDAGVSFHDIYFRVARAIACCALGRAVDAERHLLDAMAIALPHGFITPFAESITAFGGLLERLLKREYPAFYAPVTEQWNRSFSHWLSFHNRFTKDNIALILSLRDYQIAHLAARGVPNAQIAAQFHISTGTLKNRLNKIYGELFIGNREDLSKLIL